MRRPIHLCRCASARCAGLLTRRRRRRQQLAGRSPSILAAALLLTAPAAAIVYVMPTDEAMVARSPVIAFGEVVATEPGPAGGPLSTDVMFQVEEVLKGFVPGGTIVIRQPGGVRPDGLVGRVAGLPALTEGDRVLLFLRPVDGVYRTVELALGMFFETPAAGRVVLQREPSLRVGAVADGSTAGARVDEWRPRDAIRFRRWIADHVAGADRPADYFTSDPGDEPTAVVSAFNLAPADGCPRPELPTRWREFDRGRSVGMVVHADGQRGVPGGGMSQVLAAMEAWNEDPRSRINLVRGGLTNQEPSLDFDGTNSITFEDPHDEIDGTYDPASGGVLAYAHWYYWCSEHTIPGRPGVEAYEMAEANITTQDGYHRWVASTENPRRAHAQIMAHELGHVLGLGHSCGDEKSGPCVSDEEKGTIMRSHIGDDLIEGAALLSAARKIRPSAARNAVQRVRRRAAVNTPFAESGGTARNLVERSTPPNWTAELHRGPCASSRKRTSPAVRRRV